MKCYLGIRDSSIVYQSAPRGGGKRFGIDLSERNFVRVRLPDREEVVA